MLERWFSPITLKRIRKFKRLRRGYLSFLIIFALYVLSFFSEFLINGTALLVRYQGQWYCPIARYYSGRTFGLEQEAVNYRRLAEQFQKEPASGNYVLLPPYPFGPNENLMDEIAEQPPTPPTHQHWLGTDDRGRDVFARLAYGFRISISFALVVTGISYFIGVTTGAMLGYFGGRVDIIGLRFVEIWSTMPFLYTLMIVASITRPNFFMLAFLLAAFYWMGITYYVRGEFLREKARDYVSAAVAIGASDRSIMFKHILPNSLTPIISFAPFAIVGEIGALVSLDFLGFGLPAPTPSWGELMGQGMGNLTKWWLVLSPFGALFATLLLISFIGEAAREAFDPKPYARLR